MTPAEVYDRLIARGEAAGLTLSRSPVSVRHQPDTAADRAFNVFPTSDLDTEAGREHSNRRMVMRSTFTLETTHKVAPAKGQERTVYRKALDDELLLIQTVWDPGNTLLQGNTRIGFGGSRKEIIGGGAYLLTTMTWVVQHHVPLTAGGSDT